MRVDQRFLLKLIQAGLTDEKIAKRMGISVEEAALQRKQIQVHIEGAKQNGYPELIDRFTMLCQQYYALGEGLKDISFIASSIMTPGELAELITDDKEETLRNLLARAIVLQPYQPVTDIPVAEEDETK